MSSPINQSRNRNYENLESIFLENSKNQKHRLTISKNLKYIQLILKIYYPLSKKIIFYLLH